MLNKMKNFYIKGITVVEIVVVLAIIILLVAIVLPQFSKTRENQVLKNAVADIMSALNKASSQTLSSVNSSEYGVHFQSDKVIIFTGTSFSEGVGDNEMINIIAPATISDISLTGGAYDIYFNRLSGTPSKIGTVTITSGSSSSVITIGATGIVSVN